MNTSSTKANHSTTNNRAVINVVLAILLVTTLLLSLYALIRIDHSPPSITNTLSTEP